MDRAFLTVVAAVTLLLGAGCALAQQQERELVLRASAIGPAQRNLLLGTVQAHVEAVNWGAGAGFLRFSAIRRVEMNADALKALTDDLLPSCPRNLPRCIDLLKGVELSGTAPSPPVSGPITVEVGRVMPFRNVETLDHRILRVRATIDGTLTTIPVQLVVREAPRDAAASRDDSPAGAVTEVLSLMTTADVLSPEVCRFFVDPPACETDSRAAKNTLRYSDIGVWRRIYARMEFSIVRTSIEGDAATVTVTLLRDDFDRVLKEVTRKEPRFMQSYRREYDRPLPSHLGEFHRHVDLVLAFSPAVRGTETITVALRRIAGQWRLLDRRQL